MRTSSILCFHHRMTPRSKHIYVFVIKRRHFSPLLCSWSFLSPLLCSWTFLKGWLLSLLFHITYAKFTNFIIFLLFFSLNFIVFSLIVFLFLVIRCDLLSTCFLNFLLLTFHFCYLFLYIIIYCFFFVLIIFLYYIFFYFSTFLFITCKYDLYRWKAN